MHPMDAATLPLSAEILRAFNLFTLPTYRDIAMQDDERCCGTGTCIIDANGWCWCGQQWDGEKMCRPTADALPQASSESDLAMPASSSVPE